MQNCAQKHIMQKGAVLYKNIKTVFSNKKIVIQKIKKVYFAYKSPKLLFFILGFVIDKMHI